MASTARACSGLGDVLEQLRERNRREGGSSGAVVRAYREILRENAQLRGRATSLDRQCMALQEDKALLKAELLERDDADARGAQADALSRKNAELSEEVMQSYKENARIAQELAAKVADLQQLREERERLLARAESLAASCEQLKTQVCQAEEQAAEGEKARALLSSELQACREQVASLDAAVVRAKKENDGLVDTLLLMKQKEAERMNQANDYYENVVTNANRLAQQLSAQAKVSPRGDTRISALQGEEWEDLSAEDCAPRAARAFLRSAHDGPIHACSFSADGSGTFATGGADRSVKLWSMAQCQGGTGAPVATLQGSMGSVLDVKIAPGGGKAQTIVAACADGALRVWDATTKRMKHTLTGHRDKVFSVSYLPGDAARCVSGGQDRTIRVWDMQKGYCAQTIACGSTCFDAATSMDGSFVYSAHFDGSVRVWDARRGALEKSLQGLHGSQVLGLALTRGGGQLVSVGKDGCVKLIDLTTFEVVATMRLPAQLRLAGAGRITVCSSPTDAHIACGAADGTLVVWDLAGAAKGGAAAAPAQLKKHSGGVQACAWSPQSSAVVSGDHKGDVVVWE